MQFYNKRISQAVEVLSNYKPKEPFANFLKEYFKKHKEMGSRDRKEVRNLSYLAIRWMALTNKDSQAFKLFAEQIADFRTLEKTIAETHLSNDKLLDYLTTQLSSQVSLEDYLAYIKKPLPVYLLDISKEKILYNKLLQGNIEAEQLPSKAIKIPADSNLNSVVLPDFTYIVQDLGCQLACENLAQFKGDLWWDACSGAGGKTINLLNGKPKIKIHCTDNRGSILEELKSRIPNRFGRSITLNVVNLLRDNLSMSHSFNHILIDAPCSGSGTWARSPENFLNISSELVEDYANQQQNILVRIFESAKPNTHIHYITCSAFAIENELNIKKLIEKYPENIQVISDQYFNGTNAEYETIYLCSLLKVA
ncbi:MAG: hypothetical protein SGJ04_09630 [Bacteroidota bacterium]|nr:hypothetical protein [Bacteroidota bacterium]